MKNLIANIKANKTVIIRRSLIVLGSAVAITLVVLVANGKFEDDVEVEVIEK